MIEERNVLRYQILSVATLSAATLLLETTLTRFLAVAQFYHFAFLVVSLALLGFGASGTLLSSIPHLLAVPFNRLMAFLGLGFLVSVGFAYGFVNFLPFDSYSIAWDNRQVLLFVLYYLVLIIPFIISGLGVGSAIAKGGYSSHKFYAANLIGSGVGALLAPLALHLAGVPGAILLSAIMGAVVSLTVNNQKIWKHPWVNKLLILLLTGGLIVFVILVSLNLQSSAPLGMTISQYKGLSQALRNPTAETIFKRWNAISRIDLVSGAGTHQMPGLSYLYPDELPEQMGLSLDADHLRAVTLIPPDEFDAAQYLPEHIAFEIQPEARVLVIEPGGGLGLLQALAGGASHTTAVLENPLVPQAIASAVGDHNVYNHPNVRTVNENSRVFLHQEDELFDIIYLPLTDAFRPVTSGAYSLTEEYSLTIEAFNLIISRLKPGGIYVFTRWLQVPPSESLRAVALIVEALEESSHLKAAESIIIFRGIQTMTVLVRPEGWPQELLDAVRNFTEEQKFDLVWIPGIQEVDVNRFNRFPEPSLYLAVRDLLSVQDRNNYYDQYLYQISPPRDDKPFFFHFFTWEQTPEILASYGHIWQPFGGSGYFVLLALLLLTAILSLVMILFPLLRNKRLRKEATKNRWVVMAFFSLLGMAFMFIEIPLIQRWILLLGHPTFAFTAVVTAMLCFSGLGSILSRDAWLPKYAVFPMLFFFALVTPIIISQFSEVLLKMPLWGRLVVSILSLAPMGILMGLPFPLGVAWLERTGQSWIPMAWAVNGSTSVVASVLAAIFSLSFGYSIVLFLGACAYAGAGLFYMRYMYD